MQLSGIIENFQEIFFPVIPPIPSSDLPPGVMNWAGMGSEDTLFFNGLDGKLQCLPSHHGGARREAFFVQAQTAHLLR